MTPSDKKESDEEYEVTPNNIKTDPIGSLFGNLGGVLGNVPEGNAGGEMPESYPVGFKYELVYVDNDDKKGALIYILNTETGNVICYTFEKGKVKNYSSAMELIHKKEK